MDPIMIQRIKNTGFSVYGKEGQEVQTFEKGISVEFKSSVDSELLLENLNMIDQNLNITEFLSGRLFVFMGAENDEEVERIIENKNFETYRKYKLE